jgi:hypothetical protein
MSNPYQIATSTLQLIDSQIWSSVAEQHIATMVPQQVENVNTYIFDSFIMQTSDPRPCHHILTTAPDHRSLLRDNLFINHLKI